jgi:hypothetical protein
MARRGVNDKQEAARVPDLTRQQQLAAIMDARKSACPNTYTGGCRCPEHDPGLMAHAPDLEAYARALDACRPPTPTRLHVVTMGPPTEPNHDGSMTCPCKRCGRERSRLSAKGAGQAQFRVRAPRAMRDAA